MVETLGTLPILDIFPGDIFWLDQNNVYQGGNLQQALVVGYKTREELVGKRNKDFPCFQGRLELAAAVDKVNLEVMESGVSRIIEETVTLADGLYHTFLSYKIPLRDERGNVVGLFGVAEDITEQKRTDAELRERLATLELTLTNIISNIPGYVFWKDKNGVYLGCNDRLAKSVQMHSGREIIGKTDFDLSWPEGYAQNYHNTDLRVMQTGESEVVEQCAKLDGKEVIVLTHKAPLKNRYGEIIGIVGVSTDITDRRQKEIDKTEMLENLAVASAIKVKTEEETKQATAILAGSIAHDLRTPLAILRLIGQGLGQSLPCLIEAYEIIQKERLPLKTKIGGAQLCTRQKAV